MRRIELVAALLVLTGCASCPGTQSRRPAPREIARMDVRQEPVCRRRPIETSLDTEPLTPIRREHPRIGRLRGKGSLSIGTPVRGFVVDGMELPLRGNHHKVMKEQAGRGTNHAIDDLVKAIQKAAGDVARRHSGSILPVGNLSRGGGGQIRWSISHRSGRDADFGFYLVDSGGRQVFQESMVHIDRDGKASVAGVDARFDPARNWLLVKSLITNRKISVQWIFMADHLKKRLLEHARARREPAELVALASDAIAQPRGRSHDDHIHLRIYCPRDDLLEGCIDIGSDRPWYSPPGPELDARYRELARLSRSRDPGTRRDAVAALGHFGDRRAVGIAARLLSDPAVEVVRAAAGAIDWLGVGGVESSVAAAVMNPATPDDVAMMLLRSLTPSLKMNQKSPKVKKIVARLLSCGRRLEFDNGVFKVTLDVGQELLAGGFQLPEVTAAPAEAGARQTGGAHN